ncbi:hypothetical protein I3843_15G043700 [Carya illinoinensis]|uniref:Uncharacterized protein n=1 Tax=Carya illinoinensis TaxID=32201 RepID=A0A8T1N9E1_CARIL|nr:hypothetical protein CIPAW_15G049200 [Carya illinoinensis]KAG6674546.1 hypothetical protein I3842_15G047900 [Carya illinoinensis]KAG7943512.1 hypothetical protein I3843_15G043700 [Carya illinoinensis]
MHVHQSLRVGMLRKLMFLAFLAFLVCVEKEAGLVVGVNSLQPPNMQEKQQQRQRPKRLKHSFDAFFSSKRKVPNASDPLHN